MVQAAAASREAQDKIDRLMRLDKQQLRQRLKGFIRKIQQNPSRSARILQSDYAILRLRFNALLDQLDIFADVLSQRSEHEVGIWMAGLDRLAKDALHVKGQPFRIPPLMCYLDRGHGAAIRRARTRLPGGNSNPVAIIRVPRERMVSSSIASSLIHETGHQGAALLELIPSLRLDLNKQMQMDRTNATYWKMLDRWISEILSDFWAVAVLGISATRGLIGVVSLPRYFVFRMRLDDPHPFPWIRVKISCAIGKVLYPDPQWQKLERLWQTLYSLEGLNADKRLTIKKLESILPAFVQLLIQHRPKSLKGIALQSIFPLKIRQPARLRRHWKMCKSKPDTIYGFRPAMVFALVGQARADNQITPEEEYTLLSKMLYRWALKN
jgi:hypothetical protein